MNPTNSCDHSAWCPCDFAWPWQITAAQQRRLARVETLDIHPHEVGHRSERLVEAQMEDFHYRHRPNWDYDNICGQCEKMNPNAEPPPPANVYHQELYYESVLLLPRGAVTYGYAL